MPIVVPMQLLWRRIARQIIPRLLPSAVREFPRSRNRPLAATSLRRWLDRSPRRLRAWLAKTALAGDDRYFEILLTAEIQILCRRGDLDAAIERLVDLPARAKVSPLLGSMRRALEMKQAGASVPPFIDQLLGADGNYFAGKFCSKPFGDFEILNDGAVHICCPNYLKQPIGKANAAGAELGALVNSDMAVRIRKSILDQSFAYCDWTQCADIQRESLPARDAVSDPRLKQFIAAGDGMIDGPTDIRLSHDPTCNLWCPACRTERITAKGEQFERIMEMTERVVVPALATARTVMMNGYGDIFSSRSCREMLHSINDVEHAGLELIFITNGVLLSEEEWSKFPNIHRKVRDIRVSIDASTPETYRRVRLGGDWDRLVANLAFIARLRRDGVIKRFMVSFVVQRDNFREMVDFYRWGIALGCDQIIFEHVMDWGTWDEKRYRENAVHLPDNPHHGDYVATWRALQAAAADHGRISFDLNVS